MYWKRFIFLAIVLSISFCASGCGRDSTLIDDPTVPLKIEFCLASGAPQRPAQQYNVTRIDLAVSSPDMDESRLFSIEDINTETRSARGSIEVPVGNMTFFAKAFEEECPVLSRLLDNVNITPDRTEPLVFQLEPIQINIGLRSEQTRVSQGDNYALEIYIEDTPWLFSFTCELEFDEDLLEPVDIAPGSFFGQADDFVFFEDSDIPGRQRNRLMIGITRKGDDPGVCDSGVAFRLNFRAVNTGDASVRLLRNDMLTLTTPESEQIEDSRIIIVSGAAVRID